MGNVTQQLLQFIDKGQTAYQVVENISTILTQEGFEKIPEYDDWGLKPGGKYYVTRNGSALIAFQIPIKEPQGFHIIATHGDSPCFKVKENPEIIVEDNYVKLNVEKYGGMVMSSWLDRALSVAGRVVIREGDKLMEKNIAIDKDLAVIPNVAIHMNRDLNKGMEYNAQKDMCPLISMGQEKGGLLELIAEKMNISSKNILGHDLFLYIREKAKVVGAEEEFVVAPRLDDLQSVFASVTALIKAASQNFISVCAVFDNEEVGSSTRQGANSTFLTEVMEHLQESLSITKQRYRKLLSNSFLLSADNAHAVHPNHPEYADPTNRPYLNKGMVIKYHGGQKYTTDGISAAKIKDICDKVGVPYQTYCNRSDIAGGSTLGNCVVTQVSIPSVDIGLPQLAMHSAVETAGALDTEYAIKAMHLFYEE